MAKVGVVTGYTGDFSVSKLLGNDNPKIARFESVPLIIKGWKTAVWIPSSATAQSLPTMKNNPTKGLDFISCLTSLSKTTASLHAKATKQPSNVERCAEKVRESGEYENLRQILAKEGEKAEAAK